MEIKKRGINTSGLTVWTLKKKNCTLVVILKQTFMKLVTETF